MQPKRFSVKYFVQGSVNFDLSALVPVFQRWIQQHAVEGLLIDVADYKHVYQGPGVVLIGHQGDYSFDLRNGQPGVLYTRKQEPQATLADDLRLAFRLAGDAARQLEEEDALNGVRFDYRQAEILFLDRLNTPNKSEAFESVLSSVQQVAEELFKTEAAEVASVEQDPRKPLTVHIVAAQEVRS